MQADRFICFVVTVLPVRGADEAYEEIMGELGTIEEQLEDLRAEGERELVCDLCAHYVPMSADTSG